MDRGIRSRLEMGERVRDFSRAHPSADANYASVLGRLEERLVRLEALAQEQVAGKSAARAAAVQRQMVRDRAHDALRHLVRVAEVAAVEEPALAARFRMPPSNGAGEAYLAIARDLLAQGRAAQDRLEQHGLAAGALEELATALDAFHAQITAANDAHRTHVGARAELRTVTREVMALVGLLDGLNRYRFAEGDPLRVEWASARNVAGRARRAATETAPAPAPARGRR